MLSHVYRAEEDVTDKPKMQFQVIQTLISKLPKGQEVMEEVCICMCSI